MQSHATPALVRGRVRHRLTRAAAVSAALLAALTLPAAGVSPAAADPEPRTAEILPPGVIKLLPGEKCPDNILCLWRDHKKRALGYGISEGYTVYLVDLPCGTECVGGPTMEDNVSSWWNRSNHIVRLIDYEAATERKLKPKQSLEESTNANGATDNTVDAVMWIRVRH